MANRRVVISRYNEPVDWISKINCDYTIYNKGARILSTEIPTENIIEVENFGREAETFLRFICDNYDNLTDEIVFLQGNPFDHFPDTLTYVNLEDSYEDPIGLGPSTSCDRIGNPSYPGLPLDCVLNPMLPDFKENEIRFTAGAQWIVNKKHIHSKPLRWWKSLYGLFTFYWFSEIPSNYGKPPGEFIAHVMERLWRVIFYSK